MPPTAESTAPSPPGPAEATTVPRDEVSPPAPPAAEAESAAPAVSAEGDVAAASAAEAALPSKNPGLAMPTKSAVEEEAPALTKEEMIEEALSCPCISGMKEGPCGSVFLEAYKCFLRSESSPQGMECMDHFVAMHGCMAEHPEEYDLDSDDDPFARKTPDDRDGEPGNTGTPDKANAPEPSVPPTDIPSGDVPPAAADSTSDTGTNSAASPQQKPKPPSAPSVAVPPQTPIAAASPYERTVPAVVVYARSLYRRFF